MPRYLSNISVKQGEKRPRSPQPLAQHARSVAGIAIPAKHGAAQAVTSPLPWKPSGFCHRELKPGAWEAKGELEFPLQSSHSKSNLCLWLSSLPWRASPALSWGHKGHSWRGRLSLFPLSQTVSEAWENFYFPSCFFSNFHFGSLPFQQQKRQEDSPWLMESAADNTLHLKFLLIFCLDTL